MEKRLEVEKERVAVDREKVELAKGHQQLLHVAMAAGQWEIVSLLIAQQGGLGTFPAAGPPLLSSISCRPARKTRTPPF